MLAIFVQSQRKMNFFECIMLFEFSMKFLLTFVSGKVFEHVIEQRSYFFDFRLEISGKIEYL